MKKLFFLCCILLAASSACAGAGAVPAPRSAAPTAAPTPTPTPRPTLCTLSDGGRAAFMQGFLTAGSESFSVRAALWTPERRALNPGGQDALIAYLAEDAGQEEMRRLAETGTPTLVYCAGGAEETARAMAAEGVYTLRYFPEGAALAALEYALAFPPHDTPVRLIGLFESRDGEAYDVFRRAVSEGKVFEKQTYVAGEDRDALSRFLDKAVKNALPGTVDGVFAESAELAAAAADAAAESGASGLEVFSAGVNDDVLKRMRAYPAVLVAAAGRDDAYAGAYLRAQAERLLLGMDVPNEAALLPRLFTSEAAPGPP